MSVVLLLCLALLGADPVAALHPRQEVEAGGDGGNNGPRLVPHDPRDVERFLKTEGRLEAFSMEHASENAMRAAERYWEANTLGIHCRGQSKRPTDPKPPLVKKNNLTFIHIPRCAGTTIEDCSETDPDVGGRWGHASPELKGLHKFPKAHPHDNPFIRACYKHHVPPSQLSTYYSGKTTFCVVRNPYSRMISEFHYPITKEFGDAVAKNECNAKGLNDYIFAKVNLTRDNPWVMDCHMLPQAAYVFTWDQEKFQVIGESKCDHVLHQETLQEDFNNLMIKHGYEYRLTSDRAPQTYHGDHTNCDKLTVDDFSPEALKLVNKLWQEDFKFLGYEMVH